ncbi:hypothetical protein [Pseudomonas putida]|uniref:hypothetical protein n=1 Tax=Pseudomonas putida TaxID=303 RepID=UPI0002DD837D|nr:hypothetical protein [Pseudomonas putida]
MTQSNALVVMPAFGNDIEAYVNEVILPDAMKRLRARVVARNIVIVNNTDESKEVGDTVRVPMPVTFDKVDKFDPVNGTFATPITVKKVDVTVDRHYFKQVEMSDMEFTGSTSGPLQNAVGGMVDVICRGYNGDIAETGLEIPNFSGDLMSSNKRDGSDLINLQEAIEQANVYDDRKLYLTSRSNADLLNVYANYNYKDAEASGVLGNKFNFDIMSDNQAIMHKAGSASANASLKVAADAQTGTSAISISAKAGDRFVKGDILVIAGTDQTFAVASTVVAVDGSNTVPTTTEIKSTIFANAAVTVVGDHRIDLACTPTFAMLVSRKLESPAGQPGVITGYISDEVSGLSLQSMIWYDAARRKHQFRLETLFGLKVLDHDRAMRMGGH